MAKDKALVGAAGVHYVAFQLSSRGSAIGLTAPGVKNIDMLVSSPETGKATTIQVKTMTKAHVNSKNWEPYRKWRIGNPASATALFYVFVDLNDGSPYQPQVFIVPLTDLRAKPAGLTYALVDAYPEDPKKGPPTDFWCNIYDTDSTKYENRWYLIEAALT